MLCILLFLNYILEILLYQNIFFFKLQRISLSRHISVYLIGLLQTNCFQPFITNPIAINNLVYMAFRICLGMSIRSMFTNGMSKLKNKCVCNHNRDYPTPSVKVVSLLISTSIMWGLLFTASTTVCSASEFLCNYRWEMISMYFRLAFFILWSWPSFPMLKEMYFFVYILFIHVLYSFFS